MRKLINYLFLITFMIAGCSNHNLSKQQYYERGVSFLESGNSNGAIISFKKAIENDQSYFEARYQLALAYISLGKYESAEKELLKVLRLNPSFNEARLSLAKTYVESGKIDDALKRIQTYLGSKEDNPEAYELAAAAYIAKKNYPEAEEKIHKSFNISPERISSKILRAEIYMETERTSQAEMLIEEILKVDEANVKALYLLTKIRQKKGDVAGTTAAYRKIIEINPRDVKMQFELGLIYIQNKDIEKAREIAGQLINSHAKRPEGPYLMGLIYWHERKISEAIVSLQKSVQNATLPGAYYYLGLCHLSKGNLEQATSEFQRVIDLKPEMVQPRLLLAITHLKGGRTADAEKETKRVLDIDDQNAFAHNLLGSVYLALDKNDLAMEEFDRAIELNPGLVDAHIKKGAFSLLSGDTGKAEREFESAVEIAPDLLNSRIILARYYIRDKRFKEAINTLKEGIQEKPDDAILYNIIGMAYLGKNDMSNAVNNFEKAIASNPKFFLPYFNLALLYISEDKKEEAIKEYKKVLDIDNDNVSALLMMAKIMEIDKKDQDALLYYEKAKRLGDPKAYLSLAEYYHRNNEGEKAMNVIEEALRTNPEDAAAMDMKGRILLANKDYKSALSVYKNLSKSAPEIGKKRMADIYGVMGDFNSAIKELKWLLAGRSDRIEIQRKIVNLYIMKKDFVEAEKYAREIISSDLESDKGYLILASVYIAEGKYLKALNSLKTAETLNPDNLGTKVALGKTFMALKDFQKAMSIFQEIEKTHPHYAPGYFLQASALEMMNNKKEAVKKHKKALDVSPNYAASLNNLAYLYTEGYGPIEEAVIMARKAKEITPKNGSITDTLGWVLYQMGNYDDALKNFIEATYYLPGEPAIRYHLALAYLKKGIDDKAEEQLKNAIRLGRQSNFSSLGDAQKMLKELTVK